MGPQAAGMRYQRDLCAALAANPGADAQREYQATCKDLARTNFTRLSPGDRLVVFAVNHATGWAGMKTVIVPDVTQRPGLGARGQLRGGRPGGRAHPLQRLLGQRRSEPRPSPSAEQRHAASAAGSPGVTPGLQLAVPGTEEAGTPRISPSDSGLVDGGVYGTRTRGLRRDSGAGAENGGEQERASQGATGTCAVSFGGGGASRGRPGAKGTYPALTGSGARHLRIREVADLLGVSTSTVYGLCATGALAHVRTTANSIRIRLADLDAYVDERRKGAKSTAG